MAGAAVCRLMHLHEPFKLSSCVFRLVQAPASKRTAQSYKAYQQTCPLGCRRHLSVAASRRCRLIALHQSSLGLCRECPFGWSWVPRTWRRKHVSWYEETLAEKTSIPGRALPSTLLNCCKRFRCVTTSVASPSCDQVPDQLPCIPFMISAAAEAWWPHLQLHS